MFEVDIQVLELPVYIVSGLYLLFLLRLDKLTIVRRAKVAQLAEVLIAYMINKVRFIAEQ
jgi:hypothetical protein